MDFKHKILADYSDDDSEIIDISLEKELIPNKVNNADSVTDDELMVQIDGTRPVCEQNQYGDDSEYESLDYEVCESELWQREELKTTKRNTIFKDISRWMVFIAIGIVTALIAATIDIAIEELSAIKYRYLKKTVDENVLDGDLYIPYLIWVSFSIIPIAIGSALVTYGEPVAAGSGIPQVKCYLNGVKVHRVVRIKTLLVKTVGVITSVVGGLAGGKEGPMIHSGAVVAAGISQGKSTTLGRDFKIFRYFRDDHEKRDFVLGGAAAGVSSAFGSPLGGVLFSLEEAASFWNQNLIWRTLVASTISSFTLNVVLSAYHGLKNFTIPGLFNLGKFDSMPYEYFELPIFVGMGVFGGLIGALWNSLNTRINIFRSRFIKPKWAKILEAILVALFSATLACGMSYTINDCTPLGDDPNMYPVQLFCDDNEYNAVVSLWFQTPEASVKSLFHDPAGSHKILSLAVFVVVYYILSCLAFGLNVSLGIFIPNVLVGAAWGRLFAMVSSAIFPGAAFFDPGKYALIGAAAHLGGVLRMTISLTAILIESTGVGTSFAFPLILTLICAKWMGDYFNEGIYDTQIKVNHVPMLPWEAPNHFKHNTASDIMNKNLVCVRLREKVSYIYDILKNTKHNGFPVVEDVEEANRSSGRVCGIILRSQLVLIMQKHLYEEKRNFWENKITIEIFRNAYPRYPTFNDLTIENKSDYTIGSKLFMNPSPVRVGEFDSVPRIFQIFRALGLRHMLVVNEENRIRGIISRKDLICKEKRL